MRRLFLILGPPLAVVLAAVGVATLTVDPGPEGQLQELLLATPFDGWPELPNGVIEDQETLDRLVAVTAAEGIVVTSDELERLASIDLREEFLFVDVQRLCPKDYDVSRLVIPDDGSELIRTQSVECQETHHPTIETWLVVEVVDRINRSLFDQA